VRAPSYHAGGQFGYSLTLDKLEHPNEAFYLVVLKPTSFVKVQIRSLVERARSKT